MFIIEQERVAPLLGGIAADGWTAESRAQIDAGSSGSWAPARCPRAAVDVVGVDAGPLPPLPTSTGVGAGRRRLPGLSIRFTWVAVDAADRHGCPACRQTPRVSFAFVARSW
jgi:hypothetical protein